MQQIELLHRQEGENSILCSPMVGYLSQLPMPGDILIPGTCIGTIQCINTKYQLMLPKNITGRVANYDTELIIRNVQYMEEIFTLTSIQQENIVEDIFQQKAPELNGKYIITSPTDGIFYRRPSPDASAYVNEGDNIKKGQVLGLVEVMKCFNQILFQGMNLPEEVNVKEICVSDASEVKY
ncbi:MAG TPA: hypothetical protein PKM32_08210, partial [Planctomycetota bacterium]|nr:hypothetical protein [Planctomycetota bacterium]